MFSGTGNQMLDFGMREGEDSGSDTKFNMVDKGFGATTKLGLIVLQSSTVDTGRFPEQNLVWADVCA